MKKNSLSLILLSLFVSVLTLQAQKKILFNATKAETAGNADWIIDTDFNNITWNPNACLNCGSFANESNPQRFPTPAQSGITVGTPETYWNGALSAWGIDCAKRGFIVETLPYYGSITYGNAANPQDLSNYRVFVLPEPNILFTTSEKAALINFIKNGGGLFLISGHAQNDRNNDGNDTPLILNDLISNNGVANSVFGFTVDAQSFSQTTSNIPYLPADSILNGTYGNVNQVKWSSGTSVTLFPSQNNSVRGVVYKTSGSGTNNVLCAYSRYQKGRIAIIGDSSPADDGTGDPNDQLYPGYLSEVNGNHQRLIMNITLWLSNSNAVISVPELSKAQNLEVYPNPATNKLFIKSNEASLQAVLLCNSNGQVVNLSIEKNTDGSEWLLDTDKVTPGVYYLQLQSTLERTTHKVVLVAH